MAGSNSAHHINVRAKQTLIDAMCTKLAPLARSDLRPWHLSCGSPRMPTRVCRPRYTSMPQHARKRQRPTARSRAPQLDMVPTELV